MAALKKASVRWGDHGGVTVETPLLASIGHNFSGGRRVVILAAVALLAIQVAWLVLRQVPMILDLVASFDVGAFIFIVTTNLLLIAFVVFMLRWVARGSSVVVADITGITYGSRRHPAGRVTPSQHPTWGEVTDVRVEVRGAALHLVFQSNYGVTPFGFGLDAQEAQRVVESMLKLKAAPGTGPRAQA